MTEAVIDNPATDSAEASTDVELPNALGMSDEEALAMNFETPVANPSDSTGEDTSDEGAAEESDVSLETETSTEESDDSEDVDTESVDDSADDENVEDSSEETEAADSDAQLKKLLAPFRANGREMQVKNVDEAIQLMQMGANYNKKMAGLKPSLRMMKMLDKNGLLNEEKLNFLIDLNSRNPQAIGKLLQDSKIDPMELDLSADQNYNPKNHRVDDSEMALDDVVSEIADSEHYDQTIDLVTKSWDENSRQVIADTPQLLKVINDHMASGVYDIISEQVDRAKMLGQFSGVPDIDAYRQVGDALNAEGKFDHLFQANTQEQGQQAATEQEQPSPVKADDSNTRARKRAARPSKASKPSTAAAQDYNPLAASDEEFEKQFNPNLL